jgi:AraC-like DNA-binding protein
MNISFKNIRKELAPFIEKIWVFESNDDLPLNDLKTILPNGRTKIIVPLKSDINIQGIKGPLSGVSAGIFLAGMIETPIRMASAGKRGTIGIEFKMNAAYRFFNCHLKHFNDQLISFEDIFGRIGTELQQRVADTIIIEEKIKLIEEFLVQRLNRSKPVWLIDFAAQEISRSGGLISIGDLCKNSGYSKRYLDRMFAEHVGLGPKKIAA